MKQRVHPVTFEFPFYGIYVFNLKPAVERGAEAQLIQPSGLTQKAQLTHRVSLRFCASPSS